MFEELNKLCLKYNFRYDTIGRYVRIYSSRDTWYFVNKEYRSYEKVKLLHSNNYGSAGTHKQKGDFGSIYEVFNYINRHDQKELIKKDKVFYITEKLKTIYAR